MRPTLVVAAAISLSGISSAQAQRPFRLGATYSSPSLQDLSGATHSFSSLGGSIAFMTGDEGETGVTISRYHDLSTDGRARQLTLFGLDSYYYPVGARCAGAARSPASDSAAIPRKRAPWGWKSTTPLWKSRREAAHRVAGRTRSCSRRGTRRRSGPLGGACTPWQDCSWPACTAKGRTAASRRGRTAASAPTSWVRG